MSSQGWPAARRALCRAAWMAPSASTPCCGFQSDRLPFWAMALYMTGLGTRLARNIVTAITQAGQSSLIGHNMRGL